MGCSRDEHLMPPFSVDFIIRRNMMLMEVSQCSICASLVMWITPERRTYREWLSPDLALVTSKLVKGTREIIASVADLLGLRGQLLEGGRLAEGAIA